MNHRSKMRRGRRTEALRRLARRAALTADDFILPLFAVEGSGQRENISSLPGVCRMSADILAEKCETLICPAVMLFGVPPQNAKDGAGKYALREDGVVPEAIRAIKAARPDLAVITDLCLCGYTSHGHCGLLTPGGEIDNDASAEVLGRIAAVHAAAGADMVAPSAMMDRQVEAVRSVLDGSGFHATGIMSYAAKFASAFYGPFREAAESGPEFGDRKGYQLAPENRDEAVRDALLDEAEGADWLMVKPAMPYLDVLYELTRSTRLPVAAYQVSGEYAMIKSTAEAGRLDEKDAFSESLLAIKRAGASAIITYWAEEAANLLIGSH